MKELLGGRLPSPSMQIHTFEAKSGQLKVKDRDGDEDSLDAAR